MLTEGKQTKKTAIVGTIKYSTSTTHLICFTVLLLNVKLGVVKNTLELFLLKPIFTLARY